MKVKLILPALTEAKSKDWRSIKYSLFPPLGLATLAGYLDGDDEVEIVDEHVEKVKTDDRPDLVCIEVYITSAYRAYELADVYRAKGTHVILGGLHVTSLPHEALNHADTIITGPAEEAWPRFLHDFRKKKPGKWYVSSVRSLDGAPLPNRSAIKNWRYFVPNSLVVSRGCPHSCSFCYKESFFAGGTSYYHLAIDRALEEIDSLTGRHLFFLDDNIFADPRFSRELFANLIGRKRVWQGAATISALSDTSLVEAAARSGCRSLFIGFETINKSNLESYRKHHNLKAGYEENIKILRSFGIMVNASFVFGMDGDRDDVFQRTVDWALEQGIETATFHILTPYPGTKLYRDYLAQGRIKSGNWDDYDTRHLVFDHPHMSKATMEAGYRRAYDSFYSWSSIIKSVSMKESASDRIRHFAYTAGWKKCEAFWSVLIGLKRLSAVMPILEGVLEGKRDRRDRALQPARDHADETSEACL